jgi:hypothetical protein
LAVVVVGASDDGDVDTDVVEVVAIVVDTDRELVEVVTTVDETIEDGSGWIASCG